MDEQFRVGAALHDQSCPQRADEARRCHCSEIRAARGERIPEQAVHWPWLQGPIDQPHPDPRVVEAKARARQAERVREARARRSQGTRKKRER